MKRNSFEKKQENESGSLYAKFEEKILHDSIKKDEDSLENNRSELIQIQDNMHALMNKDNGPPLDERSKIMDQNLEEVCRLANEIKEGVDFILKKN